MDIQTALGEYISSTILKQSNRKISLDEPLISSGLVDSFSLINLALYVEDIFGIHLDDLARSMGSCAVLVSRA